MRTGNRDTRRGLWLVAMLCLLGDFACRSAPEPAPPAAERPPLLAPMSGIYRITRGGEAVGEERFTIRSHEGIWSVDGEIELSWPVAQHQGYRLEIEERTAEPVHFEIWVELAGVKQTVSAARTDGDFQGDAETIRGRSHFRIPYGLGTAVDFGTPLFNTLSLSMLVSELKPKVPVSVRTITITMPLMRPTIVLKDYVLSDWKDGLARIVYGPRDAPNPSAFWVRKDGLPVRVRTWPDPAEPPFELRLVEEPKTSAPLPSRPSAP